MPLTFTCSDHDGFRGECIEDIASHVTDSHPDLDYGRARSTVINSTFTPQAIAQGNTLKIIRYCQPCGRIRELFDGVCEMAHEHGGA